MKLSARATVIWSFNCVWRMCLQLTWLLAEGLSSSMAFGGRPLVLHHMHLSRGLLMFCMIWQLATCRISDPGKRAFQFFIWQCWKPHVISFAIISATHPHQCQTVFSYSQLQPSARDHTWISDSGCVQNHKCAQVKGDYRFSVSFRLLPDLISAPLL